MLLEANVSRGAGIHLSDKTAVAADSCWLPFIMFGTSKLMAIQEFSDNDALRGSQSILSGSTFGQ